MKRLQWVNQCHYSIKLLGANTKTMIKVRGTPGKEHYRRLSAKGPRGKITADTFDQKSIFILFSAAKLLTSLHAARINV